MIATMRNTQKMEVRMREELKKLKQKYVNILTGIAVQRFKAEFFNEREDIVIPAYLEEHSMNCFQGKTSFFVISGFNGIGKDTIGKLLVKNGITKFPNVTTRPSRENEVNGQDYFFYSPEEFEAARAAGRFLSYKKRHQTDWHGLLRDPFLQIIDNGVKFYLDKSPLSWKEIYHLEEVKKGNPVAAYILPPSFDEWYRRIVGRTKNDEDILTRLKDSLENFEIVENHPDLYQVFAINDDLDRVLSVLMNFF